MTQWRDIISFWFDELKPEQWFSQDHQLDEQIRKQFLPIHQQAVQGELEHWRSSPLGRLAEIIVIDQFSRNLFRGKAESFRYDPVALVLAQEGIRQKATENIERKKQAFFYMPFMHSESLAIHREAIDFFSESGLEFYLEFERKHFQIIERFGRYPHRNEILGRESSPDELDFLKEPNSSF